MSIKRWLILAGLFGLRLVNIGQSLWLDEAITAQKAKEMGFLQLVEGFSVWDFHPPLHYWLVKVFGTFFGFGEFSIRLPSVLAVVVIAWVLYKMAGWWGAVLWLINPLSVYYSQEARMYMLACMFLILTWYGLTQKKWWVWFTTFLALWTFYGSIFFLLALIINFWKEKNKILFGIGLAAMTLFPLFWSQWQNSRITLQEIKNWSLALGQVEIKNLLLIPLKFFTGRVSFEPKQVYLFVGGIWAMACTGFALVKSNKILLLIPILAAVFVSLFAPMLQYFRFLYLVPVLAVGLSKQSTKVKSLVLVGFLFWTLIYVFNKNNWREDWKNLAQFLPVNSTIYISRNFADPIAYYRKDIKFVSLQNLKTNILGVVYATNYGTNIMGIDYQETMQKIGCVEVQEVNFRGIKLDRWSCN